MCAWSQMNPTRSLFILENTSQSHMSHMSLRRLHSLMFMGRRCLTRLTYLFPGRKVFEASSYLPLDLFGRQKSETEVRCVWLTPKARNLENLAYSIPDNRTINAWIQEERAQHLCNQSDCQTTNRDNHIIRTHTQTTSSVFHDKTKSIISLEPRNVMLNDVFRPRVRENTFVCI